MTRRKKVPFLKRYRLRFAKKKPPTVMWEALIVVLFGAVMIYSFSIAKKIAVGSPGDGNGPAQIVRVEVLNGCGVKGAASDFAERLRKAGDSDYHFDVVDHGNFATFDVKETLVLDRGDAMDAARAVAAVLGVESDQVLHQELTENVLEIEVSILLGSDIVTMDKTDKERRP
jgi:hypothetical protein